MTSGVTPKVRITTPDPNTDEQSLEQRPPLAYDFLPAISTDGKQVAVVEERDGWGHTHTPGVRILDMSSRTKVWLPVLTPRGAKPLLPAIESLVTKANTELARDGWYPLDAPTTPTISTQNNDRLLVWKLGAHEVSLRYVGWGSNDDDRYPAPNEIVVKDAMGRPIVKLDDLKRRWAHYPRCSTESFKLVGMHAASRVMVFHQKLGRTSHACDGVNVPDDWRILHF